MSLALPWVLALTLTVHVGTHLVLVVRLAQQTTALRGLAAFVLPPLAPFWGFREGLKKTAIVWTSTLALYALAVALA